MKMWNERVGRDGGPARSRSWRRAPFLVALAAASGAATPLLAAQEPSPKRALTRDEAVADVGQLVDFVELTHPNPYGRDGKPAVHLRLHQMLQNLPDDGLSVAELHSLLQPFLVSLEDAHTRVQPLRPAMGESGAGMAMHLKILAETPTQPVPGLYVQGVHDRPDLAGSRVLSVEGVEMTELIARSRRWDGYENEFGNLNNLLRRLGSRKGLTELLPEWAGSERIRLSLLLPNGQQQEMIVPLGPVPKSWEGEAVETALELPEAPAGVPAWRFLDSAKATALLRLENTWAYRETFESLEKLGEGNLGWAQAFYEQFTGEAPPADTAALVAATPSATEALSELVEEMREAGTQRLVVDLRRNGGGTSQLIDMLLYFLYGRRGWDAFFGNFHTVRRLTPDDLRGLDPEVTSLFPYRVGDYDFDELRESEAGSEEYWKRVTISFARELESGEHEGYYAPPEVVVAVAPWTYSGGFWAAAALHRMGARLVGVPSGQAGNAYGHVKYTTLSNSGIQVGVSSRRFLLFPEDREGMEVLPVDVPLTEARWRATGYDPNAALLLSLPDALGTSQR